MNTAKLVIQHKKTIPRSISPHQYMLMGTICILTGKTVVWWPILHGVGTVASLQAPVFNTQLKKTEFERMRCDVHAFPTLPNINSIICVRITYIAYTRVIIWFYLNCQKILFSSADHFESNKCNRMK